MTMNTQNSPAQKTNTPYPRLISNEATLKYILRNRTLDLGRQTRTEMILQDSEYMY